MEAIAAGQIVQTSSSFPAKSMSSRHVAETDQEDIHPGGGSTKSANHADDAQKPISYGEEDS